MGLHKALGLLLAVSVLGVGSPDWAHAAGPCEDPPIETSAGPAMKATAWVATIPYTAVKGLVALTGGVVSIPVYILSLKNEKATRAVWLPAVSGTFILTPAHLTGKQPIRFWPTCPEG